MIIPGGSQTYVFGAATLPFTWAELQAFTFDEAKGLLLLEYVDPRGELYRQEYQAQWPDQPAREQVLTSTAAEVKTWYAAATDVWQKMEPNRCSCHLALGDTAQRTGNAAVGGFKE